MNETQHDTEIQSKASSLFRFLAEREALRTTEVRDIRSSKLYEEVTWLGDLPEHPEIRFPLLTADVEEEGEDGVLADEAPPSLLEIDRVDLSPPAPPRSSIPFIVGGLAALSDTGDEPYLEFKEELPSDTDQPQAEAASRTASERGKLEEAWQAYLDEEWHPWVAEHDRLEEIHQAYQGLWNLRSSVERRLDEVELVMACGLLAWKDPGDHILYRHLVTSDVRVDLDPETGCLSLVLSDPDRAPRFEADFLEASQKPDPNEHAAVTRSPDGGLSLGVASVYRWTEIRASLHAWLLSLQTRTSEHDDFRREAVGRVTRECRLIFAPALILRRKSAASMRRALETIESAFSHGSEVPLGIEQVCSTMSGQGQGGSPDDDDDDDDWATSMSRVHFPLPANEEQASIARKVGRSGGVLVQGPPGTGKSHTIANLICHLLAEGNRVLVTSKTGRPLHVLSNLIPPEIQPLCLHSLGATKDERELLRGSVEGIIARYDAYDLRRQRREEDRVERALDEARQAWARLDHERREHFEYENRTDHSVGSGTYTGTVLQIAQRVQEQATAHSWLRDEIPERAQLPLSGVEWTRLMELGRKLTPQEREVARRSLPDPAVVPSPEVFSNLLHEVGQTQEELAGTVDLMRQEQERTGQRLEALDRAREEALAQLRRELAEAENAHRQNLLARTARMAELESQRTDLVAKYERLKVARREEVRGDESALIAEMTRLVSPPPPTAPAGSERGIVIDAILAMGVTTALERVLGEVEEVCAPSGHWRALLDDELGGDATEWWEVRRKSIELIRRLRHTEDLDAIEEMNVELVEGIPYEKLLRGAKAVLSHLRQGGKLRGFLSKPEVVKRFSFILQCQVDDQPCRSEAELEDLIAYVEQMATLEKLHALWSGVIPNPPSTDRPALARQRFITLVNQVKAARGVLEQLQEAAPVRLRSAQDVEELALALHEAKEISRVWSSERVARDEKRSEIDRKLAHLKKQLADDLGVLDRQCEQEVNALVGSDPVPSQEHVALAKEALDSASRRFAEETAAIDRDASGRQAGLERRCTEQKEELRKVEAQLAAARESCQAAIGSERPHPLAGEVLAALRGADVADYASRYAELERALSRQIETEEFDRLTLRLSSAAPQFADDLARCAARELPEGDLGAAWAWAQARTFVDRWCEGRSSDVGRRLAAVESKVAKLVAERAALLAWRRCIDRMGGAERQALVAWKQAVVKVGHGKGKYAGRHRLDAQRNMEAARSAIPALITPLSRLLDSSRIEPGMFDVVIVDEASQLGPEGTLLFYVGKKCVVVGDDQQISPQDVGLDQEEMRRLAKTHLHQSGIPFPETFEKGSLFGLADRLYGGGRVSLREHFRCVPEIIEFSNKLSYRDKPLVPLRAIEPGRLEPPVRTVFCESGYKEGDWNPVEADAVAAAVVAATQDPAYEGKTIGVISIQGEAQAKEIDQRVRAQLDAREYAARRVICGRPYALQGDERDVVFMSLVIANNEPFRARTSEDDKRLFNVAASRARDQMVLFHSVRLEDLNPDDFRHQLVEHCQRGGAASIEPDSAPLSRCESPFEEEVCRDILAKGYRVRSQVEVAGRRIDLVVEGEGGRRLAVECDGDRWHRDRYEEDMHRQRQLERCGWRFWRVWGSDFYRDRVRALESLWPVLQELGIEPAAPEEAHA